MQSHAERVLGAILNKDNPRRDLLGVAVLRLEQVHFVLDMQKNIFRFLVSYYDRTGEVMPQTTFTKTLEDANVDAAKIIAYTKQYETLASNPVNEADFTWSVDCLRSEQAKRLTGIAITEAMEILERGYEVDRQTLEGHEDARKFLSAKLHEIDRIGDDETAPEGNIFVEKDAILSDYFARKDGSQGKGILSGIRAIDDRTDGFQRGELIFVCAWAGQGKSQVVSQAAWSCAVEQKKNVFFTTSETLRDQVMRRILARHSRLPMFGCPAGINSADIKKGTLSPTDEKIFKDVVEDWHYNTEYGQLNVVQVPAHSTLMYVENRLRDYGSHVEVSLAIDDYLALHAPLTKRANEREEFNETIRGAKEIARTAFNGIGVPFISPWQVTKEAYEHAVSRGWYTKASLADTSEATKSADQIIALLRDENNNTEMNLQFLKMRDDEIPPITPVAIDFRSSYVGTRAGPQSFAPGSSNADLMAMVGDL